MTNEELGGIVLGTAGLSLAGAVALVLTVSRAPRMALSIRCCRLARAATSPAW